MDETIRKKLEDFLKRRGFRRTDQRWALLETIFTSDEHFTAEDLLQRVYRTRQKVSRATIYRTLSLLVEARLLKEIDLGGEHMHYDPNITGNDPNHSHIICLDCGKIIEFTDETIASLEKNLVQKLGFSSVRSTLKVEAGCQQLRASGFCPNLVKARLQQKKLPIQ